jgi:hypothetical protein
MDGWGWGPVSAAGRTPLHGVGDDPGHARLVVDRVILVTGGEVEYPAAAPGETAATAEYLPTGKRTYEHQFVRLRDIEELPVHFLARDN